MYQSIQYHTRLLLLLVPIVACGEELTAERDSILEKDARNQSVEFNLRTNGEELTFCINEISANAAAMDVFRVFLHTADVLKERKFEMVNLCFREETRFKLNGAAFATIGHDFEIQNPMYTLRTFPEKVLLPDGTPAYETHRGGVLYLMKVQMADFSDMHGKWYLNEMAAEIKAETDALRPKEFASDDDAF